MVSSYGRELKRLLRDHGCRFLRHGKGDHEIWFSPITNLTFTVDSGTRKRYTANAILKQGGDRREGLTRSYGGRDSPRTRT